ncbi:MAG: hypothetical protein WD156_08740 [Acidimicrobiia bacterium]
MTDELLSRHFCDEMAAVPAASGSLHMVKRRIRRRRVRHGLVSAGTTLVVVLLAVSLMVPALPRIAAADGPDSPTRLLIDGNVEIPVTDEPIAQVGTMFRILSVYGGHAAPRPNFELTGLGVEQRLEQREPLFDPTVDPGDVPVVYIGDVAGRSVFLHTNGSVNWFDRLRGAGPHLCLTVGNSSTLGGGGFCTSPADIPEGRSTSGRLHADDEGFVGSYVTWLALPGGTAVVSLDLDDGRSLWQRPFGATVLFDVGDYVGPVTLTAIGSEGETLYALDFEVHEPQPSHGEEDNDTEVEIPPPAGS